MLDQILELSIMRWNERFGGTSALEINDQLGLSNEEVMSLMEQLCEKGKGSINKNVELYSIKFDPENPKFEFPENATTTHVFFPNKEVLNEFYYASTLVRENPPEFKARLHRGAHQLELVYFSDEVLAKYFDHPEFYEINDSLAGGNLSTKGDAPENRYIYVRYGKRRLSGEKVAVSAIMKDLSNMSPEEQRHWHSYEVVQVEPEKDDENFQRFLARTYDGVWVDFPDPIKGLSEVLCEINDSLPVRCMFKRTENIHLRLPVENTKKALYDCCSELYKLIGPDSIDQKSIKKYLIDRLNICDSDFFHKESGRPLSAMQLLELMENTLGLDCSLSQSIKAVAKYRIEADHKLTDADISVENTVDIFVSLCESFISAAKGFSEHTNKGTST